jgi:hypothetical protein
MFPLDLKSVIFTLLLVHNRLKKQNNTQGVGLLGYNFGCLPKDIVLNIFKEFIRIISACPWEEFLRYDTSKQFPYFSIELLSFLTMDLLLQVEKPITPFKRFVTSHSCRLCR